MIPYSCSFAAVSAGTATRGRPADGGGTGRDSSLVYAATTSGTFYVSAREHGDDATGTYSLSVTSVDTPPPGINTIIGTDARNIIKGTTAADRIEARGGNDSVDGAGGNDTVLG